MAASRMYPYQYIFLLLLTGLSVLMATDIVPSAAAYIPALVIGAVLCASAALLLRRGTLTELSAAAFGKYGRYAALVYALWFVLSGGALLSYYGLHTTETMLSGMSLAEFVLPVMLVCIYAARKGPECLGRMAVLTGVPGVIAALAALVLAICACDMRNIDLSWDNLAPDTAALCALMFADVICAVTLLPCVTDKKHAVRNTLFSVIASGVFVLLFAFALSALRGVPESVYLHADRGDEYSQAIGAMRLLIVCAYLFATAFRLCVVICASAECAAESLQIKNRETVALVVGALTGGTAMIIADSASGAAQFLHGVYPYAAAAVFALLIVTLLLILLRGGKASAHTRRTRQSRSRRRE